MVYNPTVHTGGHPMRSEGFYNFHVDMKIIPNVATMLVGLNITLAEKNKMVETVEELLEKHEIVSSLRYRASRQVAKAVVLPLLKEKYPEIVARTPNKEFLDHFLLTGLVYRVHRNVCTRTKKDTKPLPKAKESLDLVLKAKKSRAVPELHGDEDSDSELDFPKGREFPPAVKSCGVLLQTEGRETIIARDLSKFMVLDRYKIHATPSFDKVQELLWTEHGYDHEKDAVYCILSAKGDVPKIRIQNQQDLAMAVQACLNSGIHNIRLISTTRAKGNDVKDGGDKHAREQNDVDYYEDDEYEEYEDYEDDEAMTDLTDVEETVEGPSGHSVVNIDDDDVGEKSDISLVETQPKMKVKKDKVHKRSSPEMPYRGRSSSPTPKRAKTVQPLNNSSVFVSQRGSVQNTPLE